MSTCCKTRGIYTQSTAPEEALRQEAFMIEARAPAEDVRRAYNLWSHFYAKLGVPLERKPRLMALERAGIQPHEKVLEVAVGPGATLLEIVKKADRSNVVYGIDLAPRMLARARGLVHAAGYTNIDLREADARRLPFPDQAFDVLYNSYMFDLLPLADMPLVLSEFRRVLKPGGRLVLLNLSKKDGSHLTWYERLYELLPSDWVPYLLGGCRPVLMRRIVAEAGFSDVRREFIDHWLPSEIVTATKPSRERG